MENSQIEADLRDRIINNLSEFAQVKRRNMEIMRSLDAFPENVQQVALAYIKAGVADLNEIDSQIKKIVDIGMKSVLGTSALKKG